MRKNEKKFSGGYFKTYKKMSSFIEYINENKGGELNMNEEEERKQNYEKLKKFLNSDMRVKNSLVELAPLEKDNYDENSKIQYVDKLYKELRVIEFELSDMIKCFGGDSNVLKEKISQVRNNLVNFNYSSGDVRKLYQDNFSDMSEALVEDVKKEFKGYTLSYGLRTENLFQKSKTINELLHVIHSSIMNNFRIMQSMPIIGEKDNEFDEIVLYGEETELSKEIFDKFPKDLDIGTTDIVSMENKVFMMVRERGHALTIEVDETKEADIVRYFIPKICNTEMTEKLPGIGKITQNGARGAFDSSKEEIAQKLFNFIGGVATDKDRILKKTKMYEEKEYNFTSPPVQAQKEEQNLFDAQAAKNMAMEVGENGRKLSSIEKVQQKTKDAINFLREKYKDIFSKDRDGDSNER